MSGVIVTGMHHSGTSVISELISSGGWNPGRELIHSDPHTGKRFFEDREFVELNSSWISVPNLEDFWAADWGLDPETATLSPQDLDKQFELAQKYCRERDEVGGHWLAKDPRSALTLDTWERIPSLKFLFLYRNPWDVVESITRRKSLFSGRPEWVLSAWKTYNQRILDATNRLGTRAMLVSSADAISHPIGFLEQFSNWAGVAMPLKPSISVIDRNLFAHRPEGSHISRLFQILHPEATDLLQSLDQSATIARRLEPPSPAVTVRGGASRGKRAIQVIIPCKNDVQFLAESISSVEVAAGSVDVPVELTIVDGASTDASAKRSFHLLSRSGYQVIPVGRAGPSAARNAAMRKSRAGVVIPLDADNRLLPAMMVAATRVLDGKCDIAYGPWKRFGLDNSLVTPPDTIDWRALVPHNTVDVCAAVSRRLLRRLRGWEEKFVGLEDWDLWLRALRRGARFHFIPEPIFEYRVRPGSMLWEFSQSPQIARKAYKNVVSRHFDAALEAGRLTEEWIRVIRADKGLG